MEETQRLIAGLGPYTSRAANKLKQGKPGDMITPTEMSQIIGRPCQYGESGSANVRSAINHCLQFGVVWNWSRADKAWKCLNDAESIELARHRNMKARRQGTRALKVLATVEHDKLSDDHRKEYSLASVTAGVIRTMGLQSTQKRLAASGNGLTEPDVGKLLELMKTKT